MTDEERDRQLKELEKQRQEDSLKGSSYRKEHLKHPRDHKVEKKINTISLGFFKIGWAEMVVPLIVYSADGHCGNFDVHVSLLNTFPCFDESGASRVGEVYRSNICTKKKLKASADQTHRISQGFSPKVKPGRLFRKLNKPSVNKALRRGFHEIKYSGKH